MKKEIKGKEEELLDLLFKYKKALSDEKFPMVDEREADRLELCRIYPEIESISERILDSKVYLQLGYIQRKITDKFLADTIPPRQRLAMLSFILRNMIYPLFFVYGKGTVRSFEKSKVYIENEDPDPPSPPTPLNLPKGVKPGQIDSEQIESVRERLIALFKENPEWEELRCKLSIMEAEILSQLSSRGDINLVVKVANTPSEGAPVALIIENASYAELQKSDKGGQIYKTMKNCADKDIDNE